MTMCDNCGKKDMTTEYEMTKDGELYGRFCSWKCALECLKREHGKAKLTRIEYDRDA